MYPGNRNNNGTMPTTLITLDDISGNNEKNKNNGPLRATKRHKPINYIQEFLIRNFEIQCQNHCSCPEKLSSKLFIFPSLPSIPKSVKEVLAHSTNKKLPLSIFYHSDKYLKKCLLKLNQLHSDQQNYENRYMRLTKKIFKAQKSIFYSIYLIYSQMREYNAHSRNYQLWIPGGERCLHKNYYSGYVFFSAQTLLGHSVLPRLEEYTSELHNRALDLFSSFDTLYQVLYQRMSIKLEPPYHDLTPYFCDFDKFWLLFEKRLYTCYHNVFHVNKIKSSQIIKVFQKFMTKTLVYSVKKGYFTIDMAYEYDPLIMISLPRLTFVYVIYHLCNPFFFSNFPWFSKERYVEIDKINQTFNLLNKKSVEKLEYYLIYGIPTVNGITHNGSSSSRKSGKKSSLISSNNDEIILENFKNENKNNNKNYNNNSNNNNIINNNNNNNTNNEINNINNHINNNNNSKISIEDINNEEVITTSNKWLSSSSMKDPTEIPINNKNINSIILQPKPIPNSPSPSSGNENSYLPLQDEIIISKTEENSINNNNNNNNNNEINKNNNNSENSNSNNNKNNNNSNNNNNINHNKNIKIDTLLNSYTETIHSSSSTPSPDTPSKSKLLIQQNETILENEEKSPKPEVDEWSEEEEEEDKEESNNSSTPSSSSLSSSENEIIGDILVKKVFKSVCSIVDEFQSNEVAKLLNTIMKGVFVKGTAKLEILKELEEEKKSKSKLDSEVHTLLSVTTTSKKFVQSHLI